MFCSRGFHIGTAAKLGSQLPDTLLRAPWLHITEISNLFKQNGEFVMRE